VQVKAFAVFTTQKVLYMHAGREKRKKKKSVGLADFCNGYGNLADQLFTGTIRPTRKIGAKRTPLKKPNCPTSLLWGGIRSVD